MKAEKFFLLYIFITLFIGLSVQQFLHLTLDGNGVIALSHYLALPFLALVFLRNISSIRFTNVEKKLFILIIIFGSLNMLILKKSAGLSGFLNFIIEPILLMSLLRITKEKHIFYIRKMIILFFIIECGVAIFESVSKVILFADISAFDVMGKSLDMRAYSLHGHPLQNAFLVSILSTIILSSRMNIQNKYALFFIGYIAIFAFNTRSSIYFLGFIFIINLFRDMKGNKMKIWQKAIFILFIIAAISFSISYIETHSLGSRLSTGLTKDDSSSNARFILIDILMSLDIKDILFGISNNLNLLIMQKNGLVAIENSVVNLIFGYGIIFTICFLILMFKELKSIKTNNFMFYSTIIIVFLLLNTNNALQTSCPIIPILIMSLYTFKYNDIRKSKLYHKYK